MGIRAAYTYPLYFSDQISCINYFNPTYGLKDIQFQSFIHFKIISGFIVILNSTLSRIVLLTGQS